jgi:hypothetical protein
MVALSNPRDYKTVTAQEVCEILYNNVKNGEIKDQFARAYIVSGVPQCDTDYELAVQCLYILENLSGWRGETARDSKKVIRWFCREQKVL